MSRCLHQHPIQIKKAFSIVELLVVLAIVGILLAILLPAVEKVRHKGYIEACGSNLHQLGQALTMYANDNHGAYPRTIYVPGDVVVSGTGKAAADPFGPGGPAPNDMSAAIWLLARTQKMPLSIFICPYDDVNEFHADQALPLNQSNFTDSTRNLGYSYANPYPDAAAASAGYRLTARMNSQFAVMADLNPGFSAARKADPFKPTPTSTPAEMSSGNSENHEREGQNVLFGDGHVSFVTSPFVGVNQDNIYTAQRAVRPNLYVSPAGADDSVLLPVD